MLCFLKDLTTLCLTLRLVVLEASHAVPVLFVVFASLAVALLVLIVRQYLLPQCFLLGVFEFALLLMFDCSVEAVLLLLSDFLHFV